ncbi:hypothetical protein EYS14_14360 [Alteromonadaceae bacterium M269]|nr:hypothetical protein EYS14_14360 [Alteromonadaceae bacterium M269]
MNKKLLAIVTVAVLITAFAFLGNDQEKGHRTNKTNDLIVKKKQPHPQSNFYEQEQLNKPSKQNVQAQIALDEESDSFIADENFKAQLVNVAYQYNQTAQYPVGSQPIINPDDVRDSRPFEETETTFPFPIEDGTVNLSVAADKFQYFDGDSITLKIKLNGDIEDKFISPQAIITSPNKKNDTSIPFTLNATNQSRTEFLGTFETATLSRNAFDPEMLVEITVNVDNEPLFTTLSFRYNEASAKLTGVGNARPNGANLDIPLNFEVSKEGYYFVRAVLQDQRSGKPLIALQQEGKMRKGKDELTMQAHIQALKASKSEGPYVIRSFNIIRGAEQGEQFDVPGASEESSYTVLGFPFSQYNDDVYEDEFAQQRAEFLLKLGAQSSEN